MPQKDLDKKEKLEEELEHLKDLFNTGIISQAEYIIGRERIERKLSDLSLKIEKNKKSKDIINSILTADEKPKEVIYSKPSLDNSDKGQNLSKSDMQKKQQKKQAKQEKPKEDRQTETKADEKKEKPKPKRQKQKSAKKKHLKAIKQKQKKPSAVKRKPSKQSKKWLSFIASSIVIVALILFFFFVLSKISSNIPVQEKHISLNQTMLFFSYSPRSADYFNLIYNLSSKANTTQKIVFAYLPEEKSDYAMFLAAECMKDHGIDNFARYSNIIFSKPTSDLNRLLAYSSNLSINKLKFYLCIKNNEKKDAIEGYYKIAKKYNIRETPVLIINQTEIIGERSRNFLEPYFSS